MELTIKLAADQGGCIVVLTNIRSYNFTKGVGIPSLLVYGHCSDFPDCYRFPGANIVHVKETSPAQQLRFGLLADEYNRKEQESDLKALIKEVRQLRGVMAKILERT